jgi:nucleoside-diphosphate-sugar epimerase
MEIHPGIVPLIPAPIPGALDPVQESTRADPHARRRLIVIFGASTDIGRRLAVRLLGHGHRVRLVSRSPSGLDGRAEIVAGEIAGAKGIARDAEIVVSCAHARHTAELLSQLSPTVETVVLVGSTWRYSRVANEAADAVRKAEAAFIASRRAGIMLHPTMIYGGHQEQNIRRLLSTIRRLPVLPAPGGGAKLVQPIYVDDVVECLAAAAVKPWQPGTVVPIAGPRPIPWREMVQLCMQADGRHRPIMPVPIRLLSAVSGTLSALGVRSPLSDGQIARFTEDVSISIEAMKSELAITPREFDVGIRQAVEGWRHSRTGRAPSRR